MWFIRRFHLKKAEDVKVGLDAFYLKTASFALVGEVLGN